MRGRAPLRSLPLLLLLLLLLVLGSAAETPPYLPAPQNVEVYSYNFQSLLRWSPVPVENGTVLYTAEYQTGSCRNWSDLGCAQSPQPQCRFPPELQRRRWTILLRVRAELGTLASPWAHCPAFVAERDTTLGPPRVNNVSASPGSLLLSVSPPFAPEAGDILQYLVSYWENSTGATAKQKLSESKTLFQIGNLKESTLYCFRVQVQLRIYSGQLLEGLPSAPECHRTALSEATRAGYIVPLFVLALVVANLAAAALLFLWKHHQKIKYWAQPPLEIPSHFKEFLREPGWAGLEELHSPAEEEPQPLVLGEEPGQDGEDPPANTCRASPGSVTCPGAAARTGPNAGTEPGTAGEC